MTAPTTFDTDLNPLAIRHELQLSRERLGRIVHVSAKTLERWENRHQILDPKARKDFAKLREISTLARAVYTPAGVKAFLMTPMTVFGGRTALGLMSLGEYDRVIAALSADYEGLGY
ncbi:MAG: transcriptional regulator [Candidatus Competibacteraceae bacterium]